MNLEARATVHAALGDPHRLRITDALTLNDMTPQELAALTGLESNLAAHHLKVMEDAGLIDRRASAGDRRRRYVSLRMSVIDDLWPDKTIEARSVLFVCTHNSARSQFAEALARRSGVNAQSAGTDPSGMIHPKAMRAAAERGIDMSGQEPKGFDSVSDLPDLVVSVCDRAFESEIPFRGQRMHWSIPDPVDEGRMEGFRDALGAIAERVGQLVELTYPERKAR